MRLIPERPSDSPKSHSKWETWDWILAAWIQSLMTYHCTRLLLPVPLSSWKPRGGSSGAGMAMRNPQRERCTAL